MDSTFILRFPPSVLFLESIVRIYFSCVCDTRQQQQGASHRAECRRLFRGHTYLSFRHILFELKDICTVVQKPFSLIHRHRQPAIAKPLHCGHLAAIATVLALAGGITGRVPSLRAERAGVAGLWALFCGMAWAGAHTRVSDSLATGPRRPFPPVSSILIATNCQWRNVPVAPHEAGAVTSTNVGGKGGSGRFYSWYLYLRYEVGRRGNNQ